MSAREDLDRFVVAQRDVHERALEELRRGRKTSHWMWFVFPQLAGLGSSPTAERYAISGIAEAVAYLGHPVLGPRLVDATNVAAAAPGSAVESVFGAVDALKLRSSATLFARAATGAGVSAEPFVAVLDRWYGGAEDPETVRLLDAADT